MSAKLRAERLILVDTIAGLEDVERYIEHNEFVAVDSETTGLLRSDRMVGFSVSADEDTGYYVILARWDKAQQKLVWNEELRRRCIKTFMLLRGKKLIMHNAVFDCGVIQRETGIELIQDVHTDIMILSHLLDENRLHGLKPLGASYFGESATREQEEMKASVLANGGIWKKGKNGKVEMYKADAELLGRYGAKDTILTYRLFEAMVPELFEQGLDEFFYADESMPLLRGPTYELNTKGLKVNVAKLQQLEREMVHEVERLKAEILKEVEPYTCELKKFSLGSREKLSWLLFIKLGQPYRKLNDGGRTLAKELLGKVPYTLKDRNKFIRAVQAKQREMKESLTTAEKRLADMKAKLKAEAPVFPRGTAKEVRAAQRAKEKELLAPHAATVKALTSRVKKLAPEKYLQADKAVLFDLARKYIWVQKLLKMRSEEKLLGTYVRGIQARVQYGIVYPSFKQAGTTSGRYSSSNPNFQNLPRDDKRVKSAIESRAGRSFVGADYSQLEPRVFASVSQDPSLMECFASGKDFYSVVGIPIFKRYNTSPFKKDKNAFAEKYPAERQIAKNSCLAAAYGTTENRLSEMLRDEEGHNLTTDHCRKIIDDYFTEFPKVLEMMLDSHEQVKRKGIVYNLYGRPRRIPEAKKIRRIYGDVPHSELPYAIRSLLNLAMNHRVQSTAASIVNRSAIRFHQLIRERAKVDPRFAEVWLALQVHDELVADSPDEIATEVAAILKEAMETTVVLPGVRLVAEPKIAKCLADLK